MLVLTRKPQETIQIGDGITITVLRTKGNSVRLGIEAPKSVSVLRGEIAGERAQENPKADGGPLPQGQAEGGSNGDEDARGRDAAPKAIAVRAPRSRVASVLPALLGTPTREESGPLRAMMRRGGAKATA